MQTINRKWITLEQAREISGHQTNKAFDRYCQRWNFANPTMLIMRRPGFAERESLIKALDEQAKRFTPAYGLAANISAGIIKMDKRRAARR